MLSTVTLGDLGDLRAGFNAAVSGAAGSRRRGRLTWIFTDLRLQPARVATPGHGPQPAQSPACWRPRTWRRWLLSSDRSAAWLGPCSSPRCPGLGKGREGGWARGLVSMEQPLGGRGQRRTMLGGMLLGKGRGRFRGTALGSSCPRPARPLPREKPGRGWWRATAAEWLPSLGETERRARSRESGCNFQLCFPGWRDFWCLSEGQNLLSL